MLPANAPPEYADRQTLWNAVEATEKSWNAQLARRLRMALPREVPPDQYVAMVREYCQEHFVSKGMADNRKYYYLKLKETYFDEDAIVLLESMQDGMLFSNILLKLYLKSLKNGGKLQLDENIPYTAQMIATLTRQQIGTVERALQVFLKLGLVEQLDGGLLYMTDLELMIGQSSTEAERKRAARLENRALLPARTNGGHLSDIRPPEIELELELEKELEIEKERELETGQPAPALFGRYGNVLLSQAELDELKAELPDKWEHYIERLSEYIASTGNANEFECSEEYKDDGFTGTDADREDFQRLLDDVRSGKVNCVIIKDLSRLSRDYVEAGILIDRLFVQMNVRFISLYERIDSYNDPDSVSGMIVPITNVMNDQYCYQTSKKIRQVFDMKRRNGEYIAPFAPHGYIKDPKDKHKIIVDPEAAEVVKQIYSLFLGGMTRNGIAMYLNEHGVPSPQVYKQSKGMVYKTQLASPAPMWAAKGIADVLTNRLYTGDMVQGRRRVKSYKIHDIEKVPEEDWVVVENTHEAIIDKETFGKVQELLKRDVRTAPKQAEVYLFSGFLKCADCGRAIIRNMSGGSAIYRCATYTRRSRLACTSHVIKHNRLEAAVLYAVQQQVYLAVSYSEIIAGINMAPHRKSQTARLDSLIAAKEKELAKITRYKQRLYEDWKDGEISHSDYRNMREDYERQAEAVSAIIDKLKDERDEAENGIDTENPFLTAFRKYENIDKLTREILIELVDHIKIYEGGDISIRFKFADEYRRVAEYIAANNQKAAV